MRVLVTGATGFVGKALLPKLSNHQVKVLGRSKPSEVESRDFFKADINKSGDYQEALQGVDCVIHLAARVHVMKDRAIDPLKAYRSVNRDGTLNLARQAKDAGVKRFIFISTIKVNGEYSKPNQPFRFDDNPTPSDPYAVSKLEAEQGLRALAEQGEMSIVVIRPPLIYGPGVKANFLSMIRFIDKGVPLPLGAIDNSRSLLAVENLVSLIVTCLSHPNASNKTFLVSDDRDLSTTELLRLMAESLGRPARLISISERSLRWLATLFCKQRFSDRLCNSLQVDVTYTKQMLDWGPKISVEDQLDKVTQDYKNKK